MEPSQIFGVSEECHSSESGWTMYIGSPANDDSSDAASDDDDKDEEHKGYYYAANNHNDSDDDSMASDASSGPSHQKGNHNPFKGMKNPNGEMNFCLETTRTVRKPLMEKKKKQRAERKEVKVGQKPKTSVQSSSKVRKNILMSKRN
ncbi:hypothetical protein IC575_004864 [Cucumis melo]